MPGLFAFGDRFSKPAAPWTFVRLRLRGRITALGLKQFLAHPKTKTSKKPQTFLASSRYDKRLTR